MLKIKLFYNALINTNSPPLLFLLFVININTIVKLLSIAPLLTNIVSSFL